MAAAEASNKILDLLDQRPVWDEQDLKVAVGVDDSTFNRALFGIPDSKVVYTVGSSTIHKNTKGLMALRREARKAVGTHNNAPVDIIPDSNVAPALTGEMCSGYKRIKWGGYQPSTLKVTVGQHWLAPVVEAIAEIYAYDE
jgi:hypothetical protein